MVSKAGINRRGILYNRSVVCRGERRESLEAQPLLCKSTYTPVLGLHIEQLTGTRGTNTRGSVSWTGTVPVPTVPGTRRRVPGSQSNGVQL